MTEKLLRKAEEADKNGDKQTRDKLLLKCLKRDPENILAARFFERTSAERPWKLTAQTLYEATANGLKLDRVGDSWFKKIVAEGGYYSAYEVISAAYSAITKSKIPPGATIIDILESCPMLKANLGSWALYDIYHAAKISDDNTNSELLLKYLLKIEPNNERFVQQYAASWDKRPFAETIATLKKLMDNGLDITSFADLWLDLCLACKDIVQARHITEFLAQKLYDQKLPINWHWTRLLILVPGLAKHYTLSFKLKLADHLLLSGNVRDSALWLRTNLEVEPNNNYIRMALAQNLYKELRIDEANLILQESADYADNPKFQSLVQKNSNNVTKLDEARHLILATLEKSGTHYAQSFFLNYFNSYNKYLATGSLETLEPLNIRTTSQMVKSRNFYMEDIEQYEPCQLDFSNYPIKNFTRQHGMIYLNKEDLYICALYRNPLDYLISAYFFFFTKKHGEFSLQNFTENLQIYIEKFVERYTSIRVLAKEQNSSKTFISSYEMLVENPKLTYKSMLKRFGLGYSEAFIDWVIEASSYESANEVGMDSKSEKNLLARSGKIGQWRDYLDSSTVNYIAKELLKHNISLSEFQLIPSAETGLDIIS